MVEEFPLDKANEAFSRSLLDWTSMQPEQSLLTCSQML